MAAQQHNWLVPDLYHGIPLDPVHLEALVIHISLQYCEQLCSIQISFFLNQIN